MGLIGVSPPPPKYGALGVKKYGKEEARRKVSLITATWCHFILFLFFHVPPLFNSPCLIFFISPFGLSI